MKASFRNGAESAAYGEKLNVSTPLCGYSVPQNQNPVKRILSEKKDFFDIYVA
jgi:hypothetical protein